MPCYEAPPPERRLNAQTRLGMAHATMNEYEALLCGVIHMLERGGVTLQVVLDRLDYREIGLSKEEVNTLWEQHLARDKRRLATVPKTENIGYANPDPSRHDV